MSTYWVCYVAMLLVGIIAGSWFLVSFRPSQWSFTTFDVVFLYGVITALYAWSLVRFFVATWQGNYVPPDNVYQYVVTFGFGGLIDAALCVRVGHWLWFGRRVQVEARRASDLFDKLGQRVGIEHLVIELYIRVMADPILSPYFAGVDLHALRRHQVVMFTSLFGVTPYGVDLGEVHQPLNIPDEHFDRLLGHVVDTLEAFDLSPDEIDLLIARLEQNRSAIVSSTLGIKANANGYGIGVADDDE